MHMYMSMYIYGPGLGQQHLRKEGRPTAPMWGWVGGFGQGGGGGGRDTRARPMFPYSEKTIFSILKI